MNYSPKKHVKSAMRSRPLYSIPVISDEEDGSLNIEDGASHSVAAFLAEIKSSQAVVVNPKTIVTVKAGLTSGMMYKVLRIVEKSTKYAGAQVWTLENLEDRSQVTVWAPHSLSKYVMTSSGALCSQKKTSMMSLKLLYKGFEGECTAPSKYLFEFEAL